MANSRPDASWRDPDRASSLTHIRSAPLLRQHPDSRRGQAGSMPLGQPRRLLGAFAGVPQTTDSSALGEAASGSAPAAASAGGYSATGGSNAAAAAATTAAATTSSGAAASGIPTSSSPPPRGGGVSGSPISAPAGYTGSGNISAPAGYSNPHSLFPNPGDNNSGGTGGGRGVVPI